MTRWTVTWKDPNGWTHEVETTSHATQLALIHALQNSTAASEIDGQELRREK